jgi:hypothetical protein
MRRVRLRKKMAQVMENIHQFHLARPAYRRIALQGCLVCGSFLLCALLGLVCGCLLLPTYTHDFTWYLKWQDALVSSCWCVALVSLGGCVLTLRFLYALRSGYRRSMIVLEGRNKLAGRDLSPKNFVSIFWAVTTTFACFVVMLIGLVPTVLIGWTLHFPNPVLVFFSTIAALALSLAGLALTIPFGAFFVIGLMGGVSFCRTLGASQKYVLNDHTTLRIDGFVLTILHPDKPESLFDLQLLAPRDQFQLLTLLRERWREAEGPWNPTFGDEIEAALRRTPCPTVSA